MNKQKIVVPSGIGLAAALRVRGADLRMAQLMPVPLTVACSRKSRLVLPFCYQLTQVVPDKWPSNRCMYVCMYLSVDGPMHVCVIRSWTNCAWSRSVTDSCANTWNESHSASWKRIRPSWR